MNALSGRLSSRPLADATAVPISDTVAQALAQTEGRWIVAVDAAGTALGAVSRATLDHQHADRSVTAVIRDMPPAVIADAAVPLRAFLASWMIDEIDTGSAVIVIVDGGAYQVWAGPDLNRTIALAVSGGATFSDTELPGDIAIPLLSKACQFRDGQTACPAMRLFPERPTSMPACDNPAGLTAHRFRW
jgi:hypothetical protein